MNKRLIAHYIPGAAIIAIAGFDTSSLGTVARATLLNTLFLFAWGVCFTAFVVIRFQKRHKLEVDEMALAKLMNGSGIYMFNLSLLGGFVLDGIWQQFVSNK